jgi:hypothetical protein
MSHIRTKSIVAGALLALIVTASSGCEPYYDCDYRYDRYGRNDRYERDRDWRRDRYDRYDDRYYDRENWRYGRDRYSRRDEREQSVTTINVTKQGAIPRRRFCSARF